VYGSANSWPSGSREMEGPHGRPPFTAQAACQTTRLRFPIG
jgi:hypothetical protein